MNFKDALEKFASRLGLPIVQEFTEDITETNHLRSKKGNEKEERECELALVKRLLGDRRVPADVMCVDNPTDITDRIFKDTPNWEDDEYKLPYWNVYRFGMSRTTFDHKIIYIAGEHEDYYDPNFYIYNDVIVIDANHDVRIYSYPVTAFPPTDSHCAVRIHDHIWLIGSIGYSYSERHSRGLTIQVCRLHMPTMKMEIVPTSGEQPPWMDFSTIHRQNKKSNTCTLQEDGTTIKITSGKFAWIFDTNTCVFRYSA
jgi:hypothetical protein